MNYKQVANDLAKIVGKKNVLTSEENLRLYSYDAASIWRHMPDVVVFPTETSHVEAIIKLANEKKYRLRHGVELPTSAAARFPSRAALYWY